MCSLQLFAKPGTGLAKIGVRGLFGGDETQQRILTPPPSGPPPLPQKTARQLEDPIGQERRRQAAARIGVGALRIPLSNVNVPR